MISVENRSKSKSFEAKSGANRAVMLMSQVVCFVSILSTVLCPFCDWFCVPICVCVCFCVYRNSLYPPLLTPSPLHLYPHTDTSSSTQTGENVNNRSMPIGNSIHPTSHCRLSSCRQLRCCCVVLVVFVSTHFTLAPRFWAHHTDQVIFSRVSFFSGAPNSAHHDNLILLHLPFRRYSRQQQQTW